jgi:branched-chain amino acid transport system substrate-binding protein
MRTLGRKVITGALATAWALTISTSAALPVAADEPGVTPTSITIGGTHPYSGPASAYGVIGKGALAYFSYINDHGGVNGRKINYLDKDDGYSPPQAVQLTRELVEQDHVFAMFNDLGTPSSTAIRPYLNQNGVPQLFVATGATTWGRDASKFPWTIGWQPDYQAESIVYAQHILKDHPAGKVGVLLQNDDFGQDLLTGLNKGLGAKTSMVIKQVTYEVTDPSVDSQVATLKASGADVFCIFATPKFAIQALVAAAQQGWHPTIYLTNVSASYPVFKAATAKGGAAATNGVISMIYLKDPLDPRYNDDAGLKLYKEIMAKYAPGADITDGFYVYGMAAAYSLIDCLQKSGKDVTRAKVMDAAIHLDETNNPFLAPGISVKTSPSFRFPITQTLVAKYDGTRLVPTGSIIDARSLILAADATK